MPIASWRRRCSRMASGKRASMREGPLAALFRKTETEGLEDSAEAPEAPQAPEAPRAEERPPAPAPAPVEAPAQPEPRVPTPQERLRHAFSSDLPENMMAPPSHAVPPGGRDSIADYHWSSCPAGAPHG